MIGVGFGEEGWDGLWGRGARQPTPATDLYNMKDKQCVTAIMEELASKHENENENEMKE